MNKTKQENKIEKYQPAKIESKWRDIWNKNHLYDFSLKSDHPSTSSGPKGKYYTLVELPYPSGDLHIGHWFAFVAPDVLSRFKKMQGYNVFFPMGYDAFGLPAENAAIKRKVHPKDWTMSNIETMTKQFQTMGTMIDWNSVTITCLPEYYKWNQWIFQRMFEKGIAYRAATLSNWCPVDQTVLANEHVENGKCWRCGTEVVQKEVEQWFLKITEYADRLLWENTDAHKLANGVNWPKSVKEGQNNWIGRSEGAEVEFRVKESKSQSVKVFTTRPDTLFGATFMVLAPEHPIVAEILKQVQDDKIKKEVKEYIEQASKKTELDRKENKEKTGVFAGAYAINPVNNEEIPIWIADYVLIGYGTGAIMAVPGHDERDFEFAKKYNLPIKEVISGGNSIDKPYTGEGEILNSEEWNGWKVPESIGKVIEWLENKKLATKMVTYHLHDWSVSRQRYWGTPVPMIHCPSCGIVPVPEKDLPVELPYDVDYTPKGKAPLASNEEWMKVKCPKCGNDARRDAETLDTFFDSSWYFYRYVNPRFEKGPFDRLRVEKLMPLDIYFGGAEHTLGHTLYARFFTMFFKDLGLIDFEEFALKRVQHGIVLGPDGNKMSKSKGNVINPDDVVKDYGADAVRLYLSFMMPYEATGPWSTGAMSGIYRFLRRIWELYERVDSSQFTVHGKEEKSTTNREPTNQLTSKDLYQMHRTIQKVTQDIEEIKSNTAVAAIMEWLNYLSAKSHEDKGTVSVEEYKTLLLLLAPFAPHMTEELWQKLATSHQQSAFSSIHNEKWPKHEEKYLVEDMVTVVVQVNGKRRGEILVESSKLKVQSEIEEKAKEVAAKYLEGQSVKKAIYVPGKILNFVI